MNINNQLGLATHPIPTYNKSVDQQLGFIGSDGQGIMFNADGGEYWASKAQPNTSDDTLLMLNEDGNFLNAGAGDNGNKRVDAETRVRTYSLGLDYDSWLKDLNGFIISNNEPLARVRGSFSKTLVGKNNLNDFLNEQLYFKNQYEIAKEKLYQDLAKYNVTSAGASLKTGADYDNRKSVNQRIWLVESKIDKLQNVIPSLQKQVEVEKVKMDNDAFAKAKTSNTIVAYTEYLKNFPEGLSVDKANKAIDDIKKAEKIKALENQKLNATPEEKKQIDAEIDKILGVATGTTGTVATRMFLYGGVALVGVLLLYKVFKGNSASA